MAHGVCLRELYSSSFTLLLSHSFTHSLCQVPMLLFAFALWHLLELWNTIYPNIDANLWMEGLKALKPRAAKSQFCNQVLNSSQICHFFASKFYNKQTLSWGFSSLCKSWGQTSHTEREKGNSWTSCYWTFSIKIWYQSNCKLTHIGPLCLSATKTKKTKCKMKDF